MLFDDARHIHDGGFFGVWRADAVVGVRIVGELTDARNPVWRGWLDERFARDGWPRYIALDVREAVPMASLPMRIQTALWGKKVLGKIERGAVFVGVDARVGITVRAILRVVGMSNVSLVDNSDAFSREIASWSAPGS